MIGLGSDKKGFMSSLHCQVDIMRKLGRQPGSSQRLRQVARKVVRQRTQCLGKAVVGEVFGQKR